MDLNQLSQNPEQIKQLITLLQSLLPSEVITDPPNSQPSVNYPSKQKNIKQHTNKFTDMPEMYMHKEDGELDKKLAKHAPVLRSREYEPVTVLCRVCGKKETVNPSLVESAGRYKCNKCAASAG